MQSRRGCIKVKKKKYNSTFSVSNTVHFLLPPFILLYNNNFGIIERHYLISTTLKSHQKRQLVNIIHGTEYSDLKSA